MALMFPRQDMACVSALFPLPSPPSGLLVVGYQGAWEIAGQQTHLPLPPNPINFIGNDFVGE